MQIFKSMLISTLVICILIPATATAAEKAKPTYPPQVKEMVMAARKQIKTINMDAFMKVMDNPQGAMIIDVREPTSYAAGHVPGTINIPRGAIEFMI